MIIPKYIKSYKNGSLQKLSRELNNILLNCTLCPHNCKVNRSEDYKGICNTGKIAKVASYGPHFGEELPLVGRHGSGTIFFSSCNLNCIFCQNFDISHENQGTFVTSDQLADIMINLQNSACHNINFVTPTHVISQIVEALVIAVEKGLNIPVVYNSSAYDNLEIIKSLHCVFDIYMPDFKFINNKNAKKVCNADDYVDKAKAAIKEMYEQAGNLFTDEYGIAKSGLLIRHLVMPNDFANSKQILDFIANEISLEANINIMSQYRPAGLADSLNETSLNLDYSEFKEVINYAETLGFLNFL